MSEELNKAISFRFDDQNVTWLPFGKFKGLAYTIFDVDVEKRTADVMFRFEPNTKCFYHRHVAASSALVVDEATGVESHVVKPVGTFTYKSGGDVHIEGGGDQGVTVFMHMEAETDLMYEVLEDDLSLKMAVSVQQFKETLDRIKSKG